MKPPVFKKPSGIIHRLMSCIIVALFCSLVAAPLSGMSEYTLVAWIFIAVCLLMLFVCIKLGVHLLHYYRRDKTTASPHNQKVMIDFYKVHPEMNDANLGQHSALVGSTWGDCLRLRKKVNAAIVRQKTDGFLAALERLGII